MNSGQTLLTVLAVLLLGTTIFSVNRNSLNQGTIIRQTELGIYSVSLATSIIQRASEMDFDSATVSGLVFITVPMPQPPYIPAGTLTAVNKLGPEPTTGEIKNNDTTYNDFDDYNGFSKDTTIQNVGKFSISAEVYYVNQTPPYAKTTSNVTWLKQMNIKVNSSINRQVFEGNAKSPGTDTIRMSYIMGFYK
jgi:hypothetical protein